MDSGVGLCEIEETGRAKKLRGWTLKSRAVVKGMSEDEN